MTEQENFLTRWSRRQREAAEEKPATPTDVSPDASPGVPQLEDEFAEALRAREAEERGQTEKSAPADGELPSIAVSSLPSVDSITATTDIRPFRAAGVPEELKYAALRRAWVVDPGIRDFVGLAENQWDFTAPGGAPGFGPLLPGDDVRRLVAHVIGDQAETPSDAPQAQPASTAQPPVSKAESASADESAGADDATEPGDAALPTTFNELFDSQNEVIVQDENIDAALQNSATSNDENRPSVRRTHGSALPK